MPEPSVCSGLARVSHLIEVADDADKGLVRRTQDKGDGAGPHQVDMRAAAYIGRQPLGRVGAAEEVVKL